MVNVKKLDNPQWVVKLHETLSKYDHLFDTPVDIIIDKVYRGEYVVFDVNGEVEAVGMIYRNGLKRTFFMYWCSGKNLATNISEFCEYVKNELACVQMEFRSDTPAHNRLYRRLWRNYKLSESTIFMAKL